MGRVEQPEGLLIPPHRLIEQGQLPGGLRFAQDRAGAHRQLHRGAQPRFGQRVAAGLPVHSPDHLIGVGLVQPGSQPVEDAQCGFRILPGLIVALPGQMDFGVVEESEALEVDVPDGFGDLEAAAEVAVGVVPQLAIGAHHAQVVVDDGAAPVVADALERDQRALIVHQSLGQGALDVRQDPQVLFGAPAQLGAGSAQLQRPVELLPGRIDGPGLEVESGKGIEGLGREHLVADLGGGLLAALAQLPGQVRLVPVMVHHAKPAERFGEDPILSVALGRLNRGLVRLHRLRHASRPLVGSCLPEQIRRLLQLAGHVNTPPRNGRSG